jgi:2-polyprenyl-3-methyl-5-hydroxy-6-metoxy-1,4-benzoquinol methylase
MPPTVSFDNYAQEVSARFGDLSQTDPNQLKLWGKAYAPLRDALRNARRVLDHGCGAGEFLQFLGSGTSAQLVGCDVSPSQLDVARKRLEGRSGVTLRGIETPADEATFDLVFSLHVIEHIPDAELPAFVRLLCGRVAQGGKLIIATPNGLNPISSAYFMAADRTHLRMHSPLSLAQLLVPEGFRIDAVHRELPQIYDFKTFLKTAVWWTSSIFLKPTLLAHAAGVRRHQVPLILAPTFYVVASKAAQGS